MGLLFSRKTVKTSVAEHLLAAISTHELQPGERIVEGQMAQALGVAKSMAKWTSA